jgi:hypothetical protein
MNAPTPAAGDQQSRQGMNIVALVGRRIDADNAATPHFPLEHEPAVKERIRSVLQETQAEILVCSAACGADLLALEVARQMHLRVHLILPLDRERFRETSVVDRPGKWGPRFDQQVDAARDEGALRVLEPGPNPHEAYLRGVEAILDQAVACSDQTATGEAAATRGHITAVAVWDGHSRGPRDVTEAFLRGADARGIPVRHVSTS